MVMSLGVHEPFFFFFFFFFLKKNKGPVREHYSLNKVNIAYSQYGAILIRAFQLTRIRLYNTHYFWFRSMTLYEFSLSFFLIDQDD